MDLNKLKKLSGKRILNMRELYRKAGLSPSSMNSRISQMNGKLNQEEKQALELAIVNQIETIVNDIELSKAKLVNALNITIEDSEIEIGPMGYLQTPKGMIAIFLPGDKLEKRVVESGTIKEEFWEMDKVFETSITNKNLSTTDRFIP